MRKLTVLAAALIASFGTASSAAPVEFVALGDLPYSGEEWDTFAQRIAPAIRRESPPFVIFYGDMKAGGSDCDSADFRKRRNLIYGLKPGAVFYTPGDNDWTDCDRSETGDRDELNWLGKLRDIFFTKDVPRRRDWTVTHQGPDYPENARWAFGGVHFLTLHVVGTYNGRDEILWPKKPKAKAKAIARALKAVRARDYANLAWLNEAFDRAEDDGAAAVVVAFHTDPTDIEDEAWRGPACAGSRQRKCDPYATLLDRLRRRAAAFDRPVMLIHGSTSPYCLDRDFGGEKAPKLWRLNGPGDRAVVDAARVRVDPEGTTPFSVHLLLDGRAPEPCRVEE